MGESKNFISVVICTYNRCESLKDTLNSLLIQKCEGNFDYEVIVVDNNSKDGTKEVVKEYEERFKGRLKYLFEPRQGLSYARNKGIKEAKGEIIAFTDDDCIVDREWLQNIWECFKRYKCDGLGGRVLPLYPENTPSWMKENKDLLSGPIVSHDYGEEIKIYDLDKMVPAVGANMAFKKSCFKELGLFREDIGAGKGMVGEDTEFFMRLLRKNKVLYYCGTALIWHKVEEKRMSLRYIGKWKFLEEEDI